MKLIFLDIDGVLNSMAYYENMETDFRNHPFDPKCIVNLKKLVQESGASIVLTSSWRGGWSKNPSECHEEGQYLNKVFGDCGITILDKTPALDIGGRPAEIQAFMKSFPEKVQQYVIIDDNDFGWMRYHMEKHFVQTDYEKAGLTEEHVKQALSILASKPSLFDRFF